MTFKTLTAILCSLVMICSRKIGVEATVFSTSFNPVTWESARDRCALRNETFATFPFDTPNADVLIANDADLKRDGNQTLWVGYVEQFDYFMFKGCANETTITSTHTLQWSYRSCFDACNTPYIGFQTVEWYCFCIDRTPNWNIIVDCVDDGIRIFEHVHPEPFSIKSEFRQDSICGHIWVHANTTREIKLGSCHTRRQVWCEKNSTISMGGICNAGPLTWYRSLNCCKGSRLPQVIPKTIKDFTFKLSETTNTSIWTALFSESILIDYKRPTPAGASPKTSVVTSLSTSSLSSTLSSSVSTEGIIDIISDASSKDEEKTRNWVPLIAGISGTVVGILVIINVVFLCWKGCSKRRKKVATTDQVVHGQEGSLPLNDTVHTYEGRIGASVMTRPDPNNYDALDVGIEDPVHTYEGVIGALVMTIPDSKNYVDLNAGIHM